MYLWLPSAVLLSTLPLLLAGYIRTPPYSAGYLPAPTSTRPIETTTPRLTYDRIYPGGARQPPSSSKTDRSNRAHPYRFYSPASKSDRVSLANALDRSDTYHTGSGDVCGDFQTIGLGAGAASLLAFLVYILLTNSLTSTVAATMKRQAAGADPWLARTTVTATCAAADLLASHRAAERTWGRKPDEHPDGMFVRLAVNSDDNDFRHEADSGEMSSDDAGMFDGEESSLRLVTSNDIATNRLSSSSLRPRHTRAFTFPPRESPASMPRESRILSRQFGDDCFSEMIGALAGLAGLGALSGFSLSQSAQALLTSMMTISALTSSSSTTTTTTTTTDATDTGDARELGDSAGHVTGVSLVSRMAALAVTSGDLTCVQRDLCRLVRGGRRAGRPYDTTLPLASLPFSWLLSKRTGHRFSDLCWVIPEAMETRDCDQLYSDCSRK